MLVNLGLAADAAAIHRHEFSTKQNERSNISTLSQVSNSILSLGFMSSNRQSVSPGPGAQKPTQAASIYSSHPSSSLSIPRVSVEGIPGDLGIDIRSDPEKDCSLNSRRRAGRRSKTSFHFAHPPPSAHNRLKIRSRLLLQLQHVSESARPISALDVIHSSLFGARAIKRIANVCRGRERLGPNDLVIVPSDSYSPSADEQHTSFDMQKNVIAVINQPRKDSKTKGLLDICTEQGDSWDATMLSSNVYEFSRIDENGQRRCVRWVMRSKEKRNSGGSTTGLEQDARRFTFSVIDPSSRRHPVIAWMTRNGIDVLDRYSSAPVSICSRPTSTSPPGSISAGSNPGADFNLVDLDDQLRTLIVVTGIWVALREGWSRHPPPPEGGPTVSRSRSTTAASSHPHQRASELDGNGNEAGSSTRSRYRHSLPSIGEGARRNSLHVHYRSASLTPEPTSREPERTPNNEEVKNNIETKPKRPRRSRHRLFCIASNSSSSLETPSHPGVIPRRSRKKSIRDNAPPKEPGREENGAERPSSSSFRKPELKKIQKWCGLGFLHLPKKTKTKKKSR